jgi:hypothetical protein
MPPDNTTKCCLHLAHMRELAVSELKNLLDCAEEMKLKTDALPDELKPYWEAITKSSIEVLVKSYVERLRLSSELGLQEITRAALPPEQQTEQELLNRRSSDGI